MIRFADIAPEAKPKTAPQPTVEAKPATAVAGTPKPAKVPRKPKKSA